MSNKTGKVIGGIFLAPFILIALGIAYCEANKAYWDHRVKEMCEKDGGVTVFEKVEVSKFDYENLKLERFSKENEKFYLSFSNNVIRHGDPQLDRSETKIVRKSDKKILSTMVIYGRGGGDFPTGISHPSRFSCGSDESNFRLFNSVLTVKEKQ